MGLPALFTVVFQGEPVVVGDLGGEELRDCQREAFPRSPRRDATSDPEYRAFKISPLRSGRLLFSAISNGGARDAHGRPTLRATGCVIDRDSLAGPLRDPAAIWSALPGWEPAQGADAFVGAVARESVWESQEAFDDIRELLAAEGPFHASVASVLTRQKALLSAGDGLEVVAALKPALLLLPAARLFKLELATGSVDSDARENVIGVRDRIGPGEPGGLLGNLLGRRRGGAAPSVDFETRTTSGADEGPIDLVSALTNPAPWPGVADRSRLQLLLGTLDAPFVRGRPATPFDLSPELDALRKSVQQIEQLTRQLEAWR
jgi:hypothetical protein